MWYCVFFSFFLPFFYIETESPYVVQDDLELAVYPRLVSNLLSFFPGFLNVGLRGK